MKINIDKEKQIEDTHVAHWFDMFWNLIPECIEKRALGSEKLITAFKPINTEMRKYYMEQSVNKIKTNFMTDFTDTDTGLLNISKYDHERIIKFFNNEIK